jgi:hypothetical protein
MATGGCLCGGVRYEIAGRLTRPISCHCSQCARTSGNFAAMSSFKSADLKLLISETLKLYRSSADIQRGFCNRSGGNIFWKPDSGSDIYVTVGTLDRPTGLRLSEHIYVGSKSDYYELTDGLPQKEKW